MKYAKRVVGLVSVVGAVLLGANMLFVGYVVDFTDYAVAAPVKVYGATIYDALSRQARATKEFVVEPGTTCRRARMIAKDWPPATYIKCNNGVAGWTDDYAGFRAPGMPWTSWPFRLDVIENR